jgi:hypothetical protein
MAARQVDALEWLREREEVYRERLERASLVVEADYSLQDVKTICEAFGFAHNWHVRAGRDNDCAFIRYSNCLLIAMVGTAATSPETNTFWPAFWSATGITPTQDLQTRVGDLFLQALVRRRLTTFSDVIKHRRFVGPAALHSAIPSAGMPRVVDLVLARRRRDPALTGPRLLAWMLEQSSRTSLVDTTVERFLMHGGELAVDVLDRIIEVVVHVGEIPSSVDDGSLTAETTGLPSVMLSALARALQDRLDEVQAQPRAMSRAEMQDDCTIALDVSAGAVVLRLPSVAAVHGSVTWTVSTDGTTEDVRSRAEWVGAGARTMSTAAKLRRPARSVGVRLQGESYAELALVDPKDPLLVFDLDGRIQSASLPLPRGEVWVVRPDTHELESDDGVPVPVIGDLGPPVGWSGWRIEQVDVVNQAAIRVSQSGQGGKLRTVRSGGNPVISSGPASEVVRTARGTAVLASRPVVTLPPGNDVAQWRVEVTHTLGGQRFATGYPLASCADLGAGFDALSAFEGPLLGDYFISIRGAFGKKSQKLVSIVEGLCASVNPPLRLPAAGGVQPAQVQLQTDPRLVLSATSVSLGPNELQHELSCSVRGRTAHLVVSPPHVQIRLDSGPGSTGWTSAAPVVHAEELTDRAFLHVQLPGDADIYRLAFTSSSGDDRQSLERVAKRGESSQVFDLTKFVDTARRARTGHFDLVGPNRSFVVAVLRPQRFATGAIASVDGVRLEGFRPADDVTAAVYACTAPWLPPVEASVSDAGTITLPPDLRDSGPVSIELGVVDPWVPVTWPAWPGEHSVTCVLPGHHRGAAGGTEHLSRLLAGVEVEPDAAISDLSAVCATYRLLDELRLTASIEWAVRSALDDALHRDPGAGLVSLAHASKDRGTVTDLLIRTHLVERRFDGIGAEEVSQLWPSSPVAAALAAAPRWAHVAEHLVDPELLGAVRLHGGDDLVEILSAGRDPHRAIGIFAGVALFDAMPARQLEDLWRAVQVVPEGVLHSDSRTAAAKQLFDRRKSSDVAVFLPLIAQDLPRSRRALREAASPVLLAQLDARLEDTPRAPWGLLPAASFAWAALARIRAQDSDAVPRMLPPRRKAWRTLARLAPDYVGMDIVLADALVQSTRRTQKKADQ